MTHHFLSPAFTLSFWIMCDLTQCPPTQVRFALRVYVAPYPERVCAVWAMLAVVYSRADD